MNIKILEKKLIKIENENSEMKKVKKEISKLEEETEILNQDIIQMVKKL